jgi:hypothetical protein
VSNSVLLSINSEKMTMLLSSAPMLWKPLPSAQADAPRKLFLQLEIRCSIRR